MKKLAILFFGIFILMSCKNIPIIDVDTQEFKNLYFSDRTNWQHIDYIGVQYGYHLLEEYNVGETGSYVKKVKIYRIKEDKIGSDFFRDNPQKPIIQENNKVILSE